MADSFKLLGSFETTPLGSGLSFAPFITAQIQESRNISAKEALDVALDDDAPVSVSFGGVEDAHIVILKSSGGKVRARLTSSDGTDQSVPFDTYFILMSESVPVTAIDLTRVAGTPTTVRVFLAEKS